MGVINEVEKNSFICLKLTFSEITLKRNWVSSGVVSEGLGGQIMPVTVT